MTHYLFIANAHVPNISFADDGFGNLCIVDHMMWSFNFLNAIWDEVI